MNSMDLTLDLADDSIFLSEGLLNALDWPRQIQIMINQDEKMLLLRSCTIDDLQAVVVPGERTMQCEISGRSLLKKIRKLLRWSDDSPRVCSCVYLPAHQAVRFDLTKAKILEYENVSL